jgi:hypothetical protein
MRPPASTISLKPYAAGRRLLAARSASRVRWLLNIASATTRSAPTRSLAIAANPPERAQPLPERVEAVGRIGRGHYPKKTYPRHPRRLLGLILLRVGRGAHRGQRDGGAREQAATGDHGAS